MSVLRNPALFRCIEYSDSRNVDPGSQAHQLVVPATRAADVPSQIVFTRESHLGRDNRLIQVVSPVAFVIFVQSLRHMDRTLVDTRRELLELEFTRLCPGRTCH